MPLVVTLRINNAGPLATIEITRMTGSSHPDSVNTYRYSLWRHDESPYPIHSGWVEHRYGDDAFVLMRKVCDDYAGSVTSHAGSFHVESPDERDQILP